jgi:hypothetical protein
MKVRLSGSVEEEVNRRLAERGLIEVIEGQQQMAMIETAIRFYSRQSNCRQGVLSYASEA